MPVVWNPENEAKLLAGLFKVCDIKVNGQQLKELADIMGSDCTPKAVTHRLAKFRKQAGTFNGGKAGGEKAATTANGGSDDDEEGVPSPPKKAAPKKPAVKKAGGVGAGAGPKGKKRKQDDVEAEEEGTVKAEKEDGEDGVGGDDFFN